MNYKNKINYHKLLNDIFLKIKTSKNNLKIFSKKNSKKRDPLFGK